MAEVVPMTLCDGDAEGAPEYVAWVPPEHAYADCADGFGANRGASDSKAI